MRVLWKGVGERPETIRLHVSVAAEVFLCVGILTGWIGSKSQHKGAQEIAKNLISEAINYFDSVGDQKKVAAARVELAYCYWRDGELNEARIMLFEALKKLTTEGDTRARAILKLATVELSATRYTDALTLLNDNQSLFEKVNNQTTRGSYHSELGIIFEEIGAAQNRKNYFTRAISEYKTADHYFNLARNPVYRADVKNNVGLVLLKLLRYKEAHRYISEARRLAVSFKDKARVAQFDDTRAQVFLAERKFKEAEAVARKAVLTLEKIGHKCLEVDALITQGTALARWGKNQRADFIFQKAIDSHQILSTRSQPSFTCDLQRRATSTN